MFRGHKGPTGLRGKTRIMENQVAKNMQNEMETGVHLNKRSAPRTSTPKPDHFQSVNTVHKR